MSTLDEIKLRDEIIDEVCLELETALYRYGNFASPHEGYAVLKEKLEELWDMIRGNYRYKNIAKREAIQVAAMAIKYAMNCEGE